MEAHSQSPRPVRFSVSVYRLLLLAYPLAFRSAYGEAMAQVFHDCCRAAFRRAGAAGLPGLWARTMLDYLSSMIEEHAQRGIGMSRESFLKLSGWALLSGPLIILIGWLASSWPSYDPYNARSLPIDRYINGSVYVLLVTGLALSSLGVFGLLARFNPQAGSLGRAGLLLSGASAAASMIGALGLAASDSEPWWIVFFIGMVAMLLGMGLFGIDCAQRRLLRGWSALPLATAWWMPVVVVVQLVYQQVAGSAADLPFVWFAAPMVAGLAGLALLGLVALRPALAAGRELNTG